MGGTRGEPQNEADVNLGSRNFKYIIFEVDMYKDLKVVGLSGTETKLKGI